MKKKTLIPFVLLLAICDDVVSASSDSTIITNNECSRLKEKYNPDPSYIYIYAKTRRLSIITTDREPSRATAALLAAALRQRLGYHNVFIKVDNRTICQLVQTVPQLLMNNNSVYNEMLIYVDADWAKPEEDCPAVRLRSCADSPTCSIAGPRLQVVGAAAALTVRLYASLSINANHDLSCRDSDSWPFFKNLTAVKRCDFLSYNGKGKPKCIPVVILSENHRPPVFKVKQVMKDVPYCEVYLTDRADLMKMLRNSTNSFLFVDYDLWQKNAGRVHSVQLPPQATIPPAVSSLRVADFFIFRQFAPKILNIITELMPQPEQIRQVLELNTTIRDIDEAACSWAHQNSPTFNNWTKTTNNHFWIAVLDCDEEYKKILPTIQTYMNKNVIQNVKIGRQDISCSDPNSINQFLSEITREQHWPWLAGVVAAGEGAAAGIATAQNEETQLILYDVPPRRKRAQLHSVASTSTGRLEPLASATRYFFKKHGWKRIGVISESSLYAADFFAELKTDETMVFENGVLQTINATTISIVLQNLKELNARVFFINAKSNISSMVICEASKLGMTSSVDYTWSAREWHTTDNCVKDIRVFTVSYWWRGNNDSIIYGEGGNAELRRNITVALGNSTWPPLTAPLADAILMIARGLIPSQQNIPELRYDIHARGSSSKVADYLSSDISVPAGVTQPLRQQDHALREPLIYVTAWRKNQSEILAVWKIDGTTQNVTELKSLQEAYPGTEPPHDGSKKCLTTSSVNKFNPRCDDAVWFCTIVILILAPITLWAARRARLERLKRRDQEFLIRLLARCERTATALSSHLVDRSALELHEELGSGHFGTVRLGVLRLPNSAPMPVAAKALSKDAAPAEEAEFLREGSALAALQHDHVVKLVGVCAADGPPLLLMEHAFFGDLVRYLRARRHLAEMHERDPYMHDMWTFPADPEACHISPTELTRLAREAASALAYLATQHYIHRDVRAANCLIDARRTLKLADFGMARKVGKNIPNPPEPMESDYKYICQRRGVFPVPWMAPESLAGGEFSYASDVWALGVLILEIATLGARPFGSWCPPRVLLYVQSGGRPPLPRDASYHMSEVTDMCWHPSPTRRATASEVESYLSTHTVALRAALRSEWPDLDAADATDSGFGERQNDTEWPANNDLRVSTL